MTSGPRRWPLPFQSRSRLPKRRGKRGGDDDVHPYSARAIAERHLRVVKRNPTTMRGWVDHARRLRGLKINVRIGDAEQIRTRRVGHDPLHTLHRGVGQVEFNRAERALIHRVQARHAEGAPNAHELRQLRGSGGTYQAALNALAGFTDGGLESVAAEFAARIAAARKLRNPDEAAAMVKRLQAGKSSGPSVRVVETSGSAKGAP